MGGTPSTGTPHSRQPAYFIGGYWKVKGFNAAEGTDGHGARSRPRSRPRERAATGGNPLVLRLSGRQLLDRTRLEVGHGGGGHPAFGAAEAGQTLLDVTALAIDDVVAALDAIHG